MCAILHSQDLPARQGPPLPRGGPTYTDTLPVSVCVGRLHIGDTLPDRGSPVLEDTDAGRSSVCVGRHR